MPDAMTTVNDAMALFGVAMKAVAAYKQARATFISETGSKAGLPNDAELIDAVKSDATHLHDHAVAVLAKYAPSGNSAPTTGPMLRPIAVRVVGQAGAVVHFDGMTQRADDHGYAGWPEVPVGARTVDVTIDGTDSYQEFTIPVTLPASGGWELVIGSGPVDANFQISLGDLTYKVKLRKGIPHPVGKAVADDDGLFHPLGLTFFWALWGWKFDRDRFKQNIDWLKTYGLDYVRILCEVDWAGEAIDPDWTDYDQVLGETIDYLYDHAGLRSELTVIGGAPRNPQALAAAVIRVVNAGRNHKVMHIECSNEGKLDMGVLKDLARSFVQNVPNMVALTAVGYAGTVDDTVMATGAAGAQVITVHTDRSGGDNKWRQVRQGYDFRNYPGVVSNNEPAGPKSSVDTNDNPLQLALMRAVGVICGGSLYVLHAAAMVAGKVDPAHGRPANIWEEGNIDQIIRAVRDVQKLLPDGVENWSKTSQHGGTEAVGGQALLADAIWSDGADHGVNRAYGAVSGNQFVEVLLGVKDTVTVTATKSLRNVRVFDPVTLAERFTFATLSEGEQKQLPGAADTMAGYIIQGEFA